MTHGDPFERLSPYEKLEQARRQRLVNAIASAILPALVPALLFFLWMYLRSPSWQTAVAVLQTALIAPISLIAKRLAKRDRAVLAGYIMILSFLIIIGVNGTLIEGLYPAVAPAYTVFVVIAGMMLGPVGGYVTGVLAAGLWLTSQVLLRMDVAALAAPPVVLASTGQAVIVILVFLFTAYTSQIAMRDLQRALNDATYELVQVNRQLRDTSAALNRSKEQVEAVLDSSPDGILLLRPSGVIDTGNRAFHEMFGYAPGEAQKKDFEALVTDEDQPAVRQVLESLGQARQAYTLEVHAQRKDGSTFDASIALAPIMEEAFIRGIVCSIRDISPLKELDRMRDAFVSNVSHELRTPITSLKLYHRLLEANPEKQLHYIERFGREIDRLAFIVEGILQLSRLDQGRVTFKWEPVDLNRLIATHVADRMPLASNRAIALSYVPGAEMPPVEADAKLLEQVLSILLTNALNYTPAGGEVTVTTAAARREGADWVGVVIRDTGPGIPPDEQQHLFERFYRGSVGRESNQPGTGLGLAIAREIVDRHGGSIEVKSSGVPGEGAEFTVWLPAELHRV
ncbi:MAG: hypothetical protein Kow00124_26810 [Anaerolineae bacterium]